jgi:hypothetical protein
MPRLPGGVIAILAAGALIASGIGGLVATWSRIKATKLIR